MSVIQSPCNLICSIDMTTGHCFGCGRTSQEIGAWTIYTHKQRRDIMDELPERLEYIERKPRKETRRQRMAREKDETS